MLMYERKIIYVTDTYILTSRGQRICSYTIVSAVLPIRASCFCHLTHMSLR
jgi:hypothetical protein